MKKIWLVGLASVVVIAGGSYYFFNDQIKSEKAVDNYIALLEKQNYSDFSKQFSKESLKENDLDAKAIESRLTTIFDSIGVKKIKAVDINKEKVKKGNYMLSYKLNIQLNDGQFKTKNYEVDLSKNDSNHYTFDWDSDVIFPNMNENDKVMIKEDKAERGDILDRNGKKLAENHDYKQIGINPKKLGEKEEKQKNIKEISQKMSMSVKEIEEKLAPEWAKGDTFVPLKVIQNETDGLTDDNLPTGLVTGSINLRRYPSGEASAHLVGYVGEVTKEDLEKHPEMSPNSTIGRGGLEQTFDKELRGEDGLAIEIQDESGQVRDTIFKLDKKPAKDIKTTIDIEAQEKAFASLEGKPGSAVVTEPESGDLLVATSSPSYDPNKFVFGMSSKEYQALEKNEHLPFLARFTNRYAPGSTFKTLTAAIGIDNGSISEKEEKKIEGLKWQKDSSWGGFLTTRVKDIPVVNLKSALVYSDNIYFAQKALEMGESALMKGLNKFPFGEETTLPLTMSAPSIANESKIENDILLADTAYGQGELMISPIDQISMYSVLMNKGNLVYPKLIKSEKTEVKEKVISENAAKIIVSDLVGTVANEDGYAHNLYQPGFNLAAKTGTAEIKEKQDTTGQENSFLLFLDADNSQFMGLIMSEDSLKNGTANEKADSLVKYLEEKY